MLIFHVYVHVRVVGIAVGVSAGVLLCFVAICAMKRRNKSNTNTKGKHEDVPMGTLNVQPQQSPQEQGAKTDTSTPTPTDEPGGEPQRSPHIVVHLPPLRMTTSGSKAPTGAPAAPTSDPYTTALQAVASAQQGGAGVVRMYE